VTTTKRNIFAAIEPKNSEEAELVLSSTSTIFEAASANNVNEDELEKILDVFIQRVPKRIVENAHTKMVSPTVQGYMLMTVMAAELTRMTMAHREMHEAGITDGVVNVYVHTMFRSIDREYGDDVGNAMRRLVKWED
jgi:hypothetical protein